MSDTITIHPTAIVENGAILADGVEIGPYCVIGSQVRLEKNVKLKAHVVVDGRTTIGEGTEVFPFASIGLAPQDKKFSGEATELVIGKHNVFREHSTVNPGTAAGISKTIIGDNGLFMIGTHIAHDCVIGNHVILANNATLGGHVTIGDHAIIGGLSGVHQFVRVGDFAIIGGMSAVENDVIPFGRVKGDRAYLAGLNLVGLERNGFDKEAIRKLQGVFKELFDSRGTFEKRMQGIESSYSEDELVMKIVRFAQEKDKFPLCQPQRQAA